MNARYLVRSLLITWVLFTLGPVRGVRAAPPPPGYPRGGTVLSVEPLKPFAIGDQPSITVHLTAVGGQPLANRLIRVFNYKNRTTQGLTDSTGTARIPINFYFRPGSYRLLLSFSGSELDQLAPSYASAVLTIVPGTLQVQTVPPMSGVQFSFNDQTETTDSSGMVEFSVDHVGGYHIDVLPLAEDPSSGVKVAFDRWDNNQVSRYREFKFPAHSVLQAAFLINYRMNLKYTDQANQLVDPARITLTRVRASGTAYSLSGAGAVWLPGNYILRSDSGSLQSMPAVYYLDAVKMAGANVVNPGQQRYQASRDATWWMHLLLYSARFTAHDAFFRSPIGSGILLEYPDGSQRELAFDQPGGALQMDALPRGSYQASVQGAQGFQPHTPLDLSHTQEFDLMVISSRDIGIMLGVPALAIIFLIVIAAHRLI